MLSSRELEFEVEGGEVKSIKCGRAVLELPDRERWLLWYLWENDAIKMSDIPGEPVIARMMIARIRKEMSRRRVPYVIRLAWDAGEFVLQPLVSVEQLC
jgi:hypothetical protein